jgi:hypothetical protein
MSRFASAIIVSTFAAVMVAYSVLAQTPSPVRQWPYRMTISGPANAAGGQEVTYVVSYDQVGAGAESAGFVFGWPANAATFASSKTVTGPQGSSSVDAPNSLGVGFARAGSGSTQVTLSINAGFEGELTVGFYIVGTGISLPPGSVDTFVTAVSPKTPPAAPTIAPSVTSPRLPQTGQAFAGQSNAGTSTPLSLATVAMIVLGLALLLGGVRLSIDYHA